MTLIKRILRIIFISFFFYSKAISSDITEVLPLTKNIVMLHLKDGYAVYHKNGQARSNERVVVELLNTVEAAKLSNYTISSSDDVSYSTTTNPTQIGRKTKGSEFTWMCQTWDNTKGCINTDPDRVTEHWIYLTLPYEMKSGKTYTISTGSLAGNGTFWTFTFDEHKIRSEAVHVNQIGYVPNAPQKYGYVYHWMGDKGSLELTSFNNTPFSLVDLNTGQSVFSGKLTFRKSKTNPETSQTTETPSGNFLSADVYECDFSAFQTPGNYVLAVDGIGCSLPFAIEADIYRMPYYTTIRGLYHNRSGIELKQPYTEFTRPVPHNPNTTPGFASKLRYTSSRFIDWKSGDNDPADKPAIEAGDKGIINTWGWYQDAGDWDSYYSHLIVPGLLMFTWEAAPSNFRDNELSIPESGNGIPDILDEASWLIRFYYRTRHEIINKGYGTGGIGTRVFGDLWGGDEATNGTGRGSWQDNTRTWYVSGEDPFSTYKYAALAAQMAFCLKKGGLTDTIDWKKEAQESYTWAKTNTRSGDDGKGQLKEIRAYAAASLYRLTEDQQYQTQLKTDAASITAGSQLNDEARWAPYIYTSMPDTIGVETDLYNRLRGAVISTADNLVSTASKRACRFGGDFSMPMLVGQATTPMVFEVIMGYNLIKASDAIKAKNYLSCLYTTADYFLGCNPLNTTWITGLGKRQPERVFHMDSWYNGKQEMAPGITPYGPWRVESYTTGQGAWDMRWPYKSLYPLDINTWPGHERWFNNYTCPMNAEFTIHQNTVFNAAVFGFLCHTASPDFTPNRRPVVAFTSPVVNSEVQQNKLVQITVNTNDPDGDATIYKVEYYNGWHKIGESFKAPYSLNWENTVSGNLKLTARVIDNYGLIGRTDTLRVVSKPNNIILPKKNSFSISAFPNPFNTQVAFEYTLETDSNIIFDIVGLSGEKIKSLPQKSQKAGKHSFCWDGTNNANSRVCPGIYFCHYTVNAKELNYNGFLKLLVLQSL